MSAEQHSIENGTDGTENQAARSWRLMLLFVLLALVAGAILFKLLMLYGQDRAFLQSQGDARTLRTMLIPAHRGRITDRNGEPLAVSAPVATIWADPSKTDLHHPSLGRLAHLLDMTRSELIARLNEFKSRQFLYLRRKVQPELAQEARALRVPGIHVDREYKRYYPAAEVASQLVGFTSVDGEGQEGMELAYNDWLHGEAGRKLVLKDRLGRTIKNIRSIEDSDPGDNLQLSIDLRLQYLAYRELKAAYQVHHADGASAVLLDAHTGEVLAMVNQPSYNPNDRSELNSSALRNRALTDVFEPGSPMKPLTLSAALMTGQYEPDTKVDVSPGYVRIQGYTIRDHRNYHTLDLTGIITKSSNVGASKVALSLPTDAVRNVMENVGLGQVLGTGFPGERAGSLPFFTEKQQVQRAAMAYGYGLSVTPLQLAHAYLPFADSGIIHPVSLLRRTDPPPSKRVMPAKVAHEVLAMMETVTGPAGTGTRARVPGYRVAGKTGTTHKTGAGGYLAHQYVGVFIGIVPVTHPRFVLVVMIDNPKGQEYYGGEVAAPVFSRIAAGALRLLNVAPDDWPDKGSNQMAMK